ncbi:MAG: hypothetical protein GX130_01085 [Candidatus Hydrogenedens sp.]|nr:hypothetical protein [Candidatus Hydrogenedens sp.]
MELKALDSLSSKAEAQLLNCFFFHEVTLRNTKGRKEKADYKNSSSLSKSTFLGQVNATISQPDPGNQKNEDKTWPKYQ